MKTMAAGIKLFILQPKTLLSTKTHFLIPKKAMGLLLISTFQ